MSSRIAPGLAQDVSGLVLGCGGFGGVGSDPSLWTQDVSDAADLLDVAYDNGITWFDTANSYGDGTSERVLGDWLRRMGSARRDRVVVCTKVGQPTGRHDPARGRKGLLSRKEIRTAAEDSLQRLGVEAIDVYLAHHLDESTSLDVLLSTMSELVGSGKARYWGLCNVPAWLVVECVHLCVEHGWHAPAVIQNGFSLLQQEDRREMAAVVARHSLTYTPHSPLAGGWLAGSYQGRPGSYPAGSRMALRPGPYAHLESPTTRAQISAFVEAAAEFGSTPAELAVAWILHQEFVTAPIIGPVDETQLRSALRATEISLSVDDVSRLDEVFGGLPYTSSFTGVPQP